MEELTHETVREKQDRLFKGGRDTGRIEYFTDAVFAIAMTLLVLDIRAPEGVKDPFDNLWGAVAQLWPQFFAYVLSFLIIAINWIYHHRRFRAIVRYDRGLIWINFIYLLFVALVPFPTSLLSEYSPAPAAVVLYACEVAILGYLGTITWWYAHRHGLLGEAIDERLYHYVLLGNLVNPVIFTLSIPLAMLPDPTWAMWSWIAIWPVSLITDRIGARRRIERTAATVKD